MQSVKFNAKCEVVRQMKQQETFQNIRQHRPGININQFVALTRLKPLIKGSDFFELCLSIENVIIILA